MEATVETGPARSRVPIQVAVRVAGRERQTTAQSEGCVPLPSADQQVQSTTDISEEVFAAADWQFVKRRQNKNAVPVKVAASIALTQIRLIAAVVVVGPGKGPKRR